MDAIDQMETFVRIVETGSLSAAARRRTRSLAAISRQLSALERELAATLILRSTRRLVVTPSGRRWYAHCVRILRELDDARADVADADEPSGRVVISSGITIGLAIVAPRVAELARRHPRLELDLRLEDHAVDLLADGVDVAVRGGLAPPDSTSIVATPLVDVQRVACAAPAYLARRGTPKHPRDLERHDALVQPAARWRFAHAHTGEVIEIAPHARLRSATPLALQQWALAGAGIALLPDWLVAAHPRALRRVLPAWSIAPAPVHALQRIEARGSPRIRAVVRALASPARLASPSPHRS